MAATPPRRPRKKRGGTKHLARIIPDSEPATVARRELLAAKVLDTAAILFASQGFAATSLKDVADAVGLQRSSIYYYYPDKDALLKELIQGVTSPVMKLFLEVEKEGLSPLAKIREVVRRLVLWVGDPHTHFRLMDRSEADLPDMIAATHKRAKRHVLAEMIKLIEAAVLAGEARSADLRICAFSILGMTMWTAWWFQPEHGQSLEDVANAIADNAVAVVKRTRPAEQITAVSDLTREIRENLSLIDRMTGKNDR
jgi:AcrR family transcriptional regulator